MLLLHKHAFVRDLVQSLPLGLVITDSKAKVVFFNPYMQKNFNVFADEFLNESIQSFLRGDVFLMRGRSYPVSVRTHQHGKYKIFFISRQAPV